jgi:hypothetical protein
MRGPRCYALEHASDLTEQSQLECLKNSGSNSRFPPDWWINLWVLFTFTGLD